MTINTRNMKTAPLILRVQQTPFPFQLTKAFTKPSKFNHQFSLCTWKDDTKVFLCLQTSDINAENGGG